ncbi:hypothetical protein [Aeoliella sp.]|uniref:hypothetical protein n=1 Tax=Aeoliella sp. TaxID=2795800 RepID=UPI003CCB950C
MHCTKPKSREKALILIRHEQSGRPYIEVYGESTLDCRIVTVPHVDTTRGEIVAEELVEHSLPVIYRDLLWPGKLRAQGVVALQRPSDVVDRYHRLQILRALDALERRLTTPRRRRPRRAR